MLFPDNNVNLFSFLTRNSSFQVAEQSDTEPSFMRDCSTFEMTNSKFAMVTICNVLMNVTVLEPGFVEETPLFFNLLKFIMNSVPTLENSGIST